MSVQGRLVDRELATRYGRRWSKDEEEESLQETFKMDGSQVLLEPLPAVGQFSKTNEGRN